MEIRPFQLRAAARVLTGDVAGVRQSLHRLRVATDTVALHPADPGLDRNLPVRQAGALASLRDSAAALAAVAGELDSAAADALEADGAIRRAPICRLPDGMRSALDRWLTDMIGDGLSTLATEVVGVAGSVLTLSTGPTSGDRGGRFSTRRVALPGAAAGPAYPGSPSPAAGLVAAALEATADQTVLAHDEFGLVDHGGGRYTVVLPGVTDLSRPQQGWNPVHRSPRDLDMAAIPSSRSSEVDDNVYARSVAEALSATGIPAGAELLIVGHSFGADTALDLAADPAFTRRYNVTHIVATGYFSQPQLPSVSTDTKVLVVQNRRDVVVHLGSIMPAVETGVFRCEPARSASSGNVSIVRFDGGFGSLGHSVDGYRSVFTGRAELASGDAAVVRGHLDSIDLASAPPATMLAIDISLPEQGGNDRIRRSATQASALGPAEW